MFVILQSKHVSFWFATGGAGVCLSRALASRAASLVSDGAFERAGDAIRLPDDVTLGFLSEHRLGVPLTRVAAFHSHLEPLRLIPEKDLSEQVSFSYARSGEPEDFDSDNVVSVGGGVSRRKDPTRFMSLHCRLYPGSIKQC